ncbi:hypothetical protein OG196_31690 [Kitasatospora purpeofusca]|uniref:hypothetical protein n=1 Tax=Kitasatospora purpeofusca TaxID=67352 RepID=UPI002E10542C|nr:hypothetical protein OG196_31690 [Kitasatospora purpeofusca]
MTAPSRPDPRTKNDVAHPVARQMRDVVAVLLLALGTVGINTAAYITDLRLGAACTSLSALAAAAVLGRHDEQQ